VKSPQHSNALAACAVTDYDAGAILNSPRLFLLSTEQWRTLLPNAAGRLLDVGAGNGDLTSQLAPLFSSVTVTEVSSWLTWRLGRNGYTASFITTDPADLIGHPSKELAAPFDTVCCLHILDRCAQPLELLDSIRRVLRDDGTVVLGLTLPFLSYSRKHGLNIRGKTFEEAAASFIENVRCARSARGQRTWLTRARPLQVVEPSGFRVERVARVPYLCQGTYLVPMFALDDLLVVARKLPDL
jgi:SAM-dependent methyltransferase